MSLPSAPVPILTYHTLDTSGSVISVAPDTFRTHMRMLREGGFTGIRLEQLTDAWAGRASLPEQPVVITFDDGFANVLEYGAPALVEHGHEATVFVVSDYCGRRNDWPGQGHDVPRLPLLSWSELAHLVQAGFEVGAHTASHPRLSLLSAADARREIVAHKASLEDRLGRPVRSFAYPYGDTSPAVVDLVREHFAGACSVLLGTARPTHDRHLLPRVDVYYIRKPGAFRQLGSARGSVYLSLRALARRARARFTR